MPTEISNAQGDAEQADEERSGARQRDRAQHQAVDVRLAIRVRDDWNAHARQSLEWVPSGEQEQTQHDQQAIDQGRGVGEQAAGRHRDEGQCDAHGRHRRQDTGQHQQAKQPGGASALEGRGIGAEVRDEPRVERQQTGAGGAEDARAERPEPSDQRPEIQGRSWLTSSSRGTIDGETVDLLGTPVATQVIHPTIRTDDDDVHGRWVQHRLAEVGDERARHRRICDGIGEGERVRIAILGERLPGLGSFDVDGDPCDARRIESLNAAVASICCALQLEHQIAIVWRKTTVPEATRSAMRKDCPVVTLVRLIVAQT